MKKIENYKTMELFSIYTINFIILDRIHKKIKKCDAF